MKDRLIRKVHLRISEWLYNTRESVDVSSTGGMFNLRCFHNAIQYATENDGVSVMMGIYVDRGETVLHFWNVDWNGLHLETTLGYRADDILYYPLKKIDTEDYKNISCVFSDALDYFTTRFTTRFERIILRGERAI